MVNLEKKWGVPQTEYAVRMYNKYKGN
jgi:hypothetical protein